MYRSRLPVPRPAWIQAARLLVWSAACTSPFVARAADPDAVPVSVTSVASGGYWQHEGRSGQVRAVVRTRGFEALSSMLTVEWLTEPTSPEAESTVAAAVNVDDPLGAPGVFTVAVTRVRPGCTAVVVSGQTTQRAKWITRQWWATTPGTLEPARSPQGQRLPTPPTCAGARKAA